MSSNILRDVFNRISDLGRARQITSPFNMYWADASSNIDTLLLQENLSLGTILNEEDVLQECIANNQGLINFLIDDTRMVEMLKLLSDKLPETGSEAERFKHANVISELFTYKDNAFANILAENPKHFSLLWSFVCDSKLKIENMPEPESEKNGEVNAEEPESEEKEADAELTDEVDIQSKNKELDPLLASFFVKVMNFLFQNKLNETLDFLSSLQPPNDLVSVALRHINTSAIMDFVFKTWEHINSNREQFENLSEPESTPPAKYDKIIIDGKLLPKLIDLFKDTRAQSKQQNAANLISDLVRTGRDILLKNPEAEADSILKQCESTEITRSILANMLEGKTKNSIVSALKLIQDFLVYRIQVEHMSVRHKEHLSSLSKLATKAENDDVPTDDDVQASEGMPNFLKDSVSAQSAEIFITPQINSPVGSYGEHLQRCIRNVCVALHERLEDFVKLLVEPIGPIVPIVTTTGILSNPLGVVRLEVIHLFVALFATADPNILEKCYELNVLKILTDLFFEYKMNNQLHKYYEQIINYVMHNYSSFQTIKNKQANINSRQTPLESEEKSQTPPQVGTSPENSSCEKILNFFKLYDISKVLVIQLVDDCHLLEKILDNFSLEEVPVRSKQTNLNETFEVKKEGEGSKIDDTQEQDKLKEKSNKVLPNRPHYLGHLRLIANILRDLITIEVLAECESFSEEIQGQWDEFKAGKLTQLNELCDVKLVEESRMTEAQEQNLFFNYQTESLTGTTPPPNIELLPTDFESNALKEAREQTKLMNAIDFDFDKCWSQEQNQKLNDLEKFFDEKCSSSLFDDDENDDDEIPMGDDDAFITDKDIARLKEEKKLDAKRERPELLNEVIQEDFNPFDPSSDPFASSNDKINEFEDDFANFSDMKWEDANTLSASAKNEDIWMETKVNKEDSPEETSDDQLLREKNISNSLRAIVKKIEYNVPVDDDDFAQISPANASSPNHDNSELNSNCSDTNKSQDEPSLPSPQQ